MLPTPLCGIFFFLLGVVLEELALLKMEKIKKEALKSTYININIDPQSLVGSSVYPGWC